MDFSVFDSNVSYAMNVFLLIGNINNFVYNIPQLIKTYKTKSTKDFSASFLFMRVFGNCIWLAYSIELRAFLFIMSNIVSLFSSMFVCYYKVIEMYKGPISYYNQINSYNEINNEPSENDPIDIETSDDTIIEV
jgi:MtN3 and saliva related transmembrane protein